MNRRRIDEDRAFAGFIWGLLLGGVYAVFNGPRIRLSELFDSSSNRKAHDSQLVRPNSLRSSIEEGKKAARERKQQRTG